MEPTLITKNFCKIDENSTLSKAIGKLKEKEERQVFVTRENKYIGVLDTKKLLKARLDTAAAKVKNFVQSTPTIEKESSILDSAYLLYQSNQFIVPILEDNEIIGKLTALNVLQKSLELEELKGWKVSDCHLVETNVKKEDEISTALSLMYHNKIEHLPVMDEQGLYGIISFRDVLKRYLSWPPKRESSERLHETKSAEPNQQHLTALPVENFCTKDNLVTINREASFQEAVNKMVENNITSLYVEGSGLLTAKNMVRVVASLKHSEKENIKFIGLNKIDISETMKPKVEEILSNEAGKIARLIKNEFLLTAHFKEYSKDGNKHKYSVHLHLQRPGQDLSCGQEDWDVITAVRKACANLENLVKKKLRL